MRAEADIIRRTKGEECIGYYRFIGLYARIPRLRSMLMNIYVVNADNENLQPQVSVRSGKVRSEPYQVIAYDK